MSLVPCICIDDTNRPAQIPQDKWIVKGEHYRVLGLYVHLNQNNIQGVTLVEKPLDHTNDPYRMFALRRFAFDMDDVLALIELAKDCTDISQMNDEDMRRLEELIEKEVLEPAGE